MASFNLFKKRDNIDWVTLPAPDDLTFLFETIKLKSEMFWIDTSLNKRIYGFQIAQATKWRKGLNNRELEEFENCLGFSFPTPLRNFYKTMNGLTNPGINLYGNDGTPPTSRAVFYSYPDDLNLIQDQIDTICEA